jgi:hypothetical protein
MKQNKTQQGGEQFLMLKVISARDQYALVVAIVLDRVTAHDS